MARIFLYDEPVNEAEPFYNRVEKDGEGKIHKTLCFDASRHLGQQALCDWLDNSPKRKLLLCCAQQSGKTVALVYSLLHMMLSLGPTPGQGGGQGQYGILCSNRKVFEQGIKEFFERIFIYELAIINKYNSVKGVYSVNAYGNRMIAQAAGKPYDPGTPTNIFVVHLKSDHSTASYRMKGVVADEMGYKDVPEKQMLEMLNARTAKNNARCVFASYPDSRKAFVGLYENVLEFPDEPQNAEYSCLNFPRWQNPAYWMLDDESHSIEECVAEAETRLLKEVEGRISEWQIDRELRGIPTMVSGAFYSAFDKANVKPYDPVKEEETVLGIDCGGKTVGVLVARLKRHRDTDKIKMHIIDEYRYDDEQASEGIKVIDDHVSKIKDLIKKHRNETETPLIYCGMGGKPSGIDREFLVRLKRAGIPAKSPPIRNPQAQGAITNNMFSNGELKINPKLYQLQDDILSIETLDNGNPDDTHYHSVSALRYLCSGVNKLRGTVKQPAKAQKQFKGRNTGNKPRRYAFSHGIPDWIRNG